MSYDEDPPTRPHRRPPSLSLGHIEKWGLIEAWLVGDKERRVTLVSGENGLKVMVHDPIRGMVTEDVGRDEDPSATVLRCLGRFSLLTP
jgi:hypothetical protein